MTTTNRSTTAGVGIPSPVDALSDELVRLTRASHAVRVRLAAQTPEAVEWAAYALLVHLVQDGPQRSSSLAGLACVDPSTVSRQVGQLVQAGLAERQADPEDGRASLLVATPEGHRTYAARRDRRVRMTESLVEGWSDRDVQTLTRLLARLNDSYPTLRPVLVEGSTS